jgi:hypothetical protein
MSLYWLKIGGGALAIFGVGMTGITAAKKGAEGIKSVASSSVQHIIRDVPAKFLAFRLHGDRIGTLRSLDVTSEGDWSANSVTMNVALNGPESNADLGTCNLAAEDFRHRNDDVNFRCVSKAEIEDEELAQVGEVHFEPGDFTRPLYLPEHQLRRLERTKIRNLKANLSSEDGKSVHGKAEYDLRDRRGHRQSGTVRLDASDGRALIEIRDANGDELFHLRADDRGVSINANDRRGRELMRLIAGQAGVHLEVNEK